MAIPELGENGQQLTNRQIATWLTKAALTDIPRQITLLSDLAEGIYPSGEHASDYEEGHKRVADWFSLAGPAAAGENLNSVDVVRRARQQRVASVLKTLRDEAADDKEHPVVTILESLLDPEAA